MTTRSIHIPLAVACGLLLGLAQPAGAGSKTVRPAPPTGPDTQAMARAFVGHPLRTLDGKILELTGSVTVINFWATWCAPCRKELPALDRLNREIAPDGGRVVAVALDIEGDNVRRFVRANELKLAVCHDGPDGLAKALALGDVPYTIVLDRKGQVAWTAAGTSEKELAELSEVARRLAGEERTALSEAAR